jgi:hypothetical protein
MDLFDSVGVEWRRYICIYFLRRSDMWKEGLIFLAFIVFFIGSVIFDSIYTATLRQECRQMAMQQRYSPIEVQVMCKL